MPPKRFHTYCVWELTELVLAFPFISHFLCHLSSMELFIYNHLEELQEYTYPIIC